MGDRLRLRAANHQHFIKPPSQLNLLPSAGRKMSIPAKVWRRSAVGK